jgi:hypothetical protein
MAQTQLADVIVLAEFTAYQVENSLVSTALFTSGVAVRNGEMASQLQAGVQAFTVPFWLDLPDTEADITSDDPTVLQVDHFRVPHGWRTPYCLFTLSGLDMRFRQAILATIACLLLPSSFAELITSTSYFSWQRACALLLELLGEENTCALLARAPR